MVLYRCVTNMYGNVDCDTCAKLYEEDGVRYCRGGEYEPIDGDWSKVVVLGEHSWDSL